MDASSVDRVIDCNGSGFVLTWCDAPLVSGVDAVSGCCRHKGCFGKIKIKYCAPPSLETSLQPSAWALMSGSCHGKCSRAQITYMCKILTSFSGWAASAVIADVQMAKYHSKSNQCFLENRRLFGFVITCDYWLVNIMTIFCTSLLNRASWMVVCLPASSHTVSLLHTSAERGSIFSSLSLELC